MIFTLPYFLSSPIFGLDLDLVILTEASTTEAFYRQWEVIPIITSSFDSSWTIMHVYMHLYILRVLEAPRKLMFIEIHKTLCKQNTRKREK